MERLSVFFIQFNRVISGLRQIFLYQMATKQKLILLIEFIRIGCKHLLAKVSLLSIDKEHFLNFQVLFPSYEAFSKMFIDIFIFKEYAFKGPYNSLIIDCGSNIGLSILYFKKLYPASTIIAFEPDSKTFEFLTHNVVTNKLENVFLNKLALYDKEGEIAFYSAQQEDSDSLLEMSAFQSSLGERPVKSTSIPCVRLSSFIDRTIDLVKLDIQGAETKVLEDLAETGKLAFVNELIIEYHYDLVNNPLGRVISILEDNKYYVSIHSVNEMRMPPYYQFRGVPYTLVVFASRGKA